MELKIKDETILKALFTTDAFTVCRPDRPFWYTSGSFGPYYINTHYLFGDRTAAEHFLRLTDHFLAEERTLLPAALLFLTHYQYRRVEIYRSVVDSVVEIARQRGYDLISGGERRDWFFSLPAAQSLEVPAIFLFKDGEVIAPKTAGAGNYAPIEEAVRTAWPKYADIAQIPLPELREIAQILAGEIGFAAVETNGLQGKKVLHIADLVTLASSYTRNWLPALSECGAEIDATLAIVDRGQGGDEVLAAAGVELIALTTIDENMFVQARELGLIDADQESALKEFLLSPEEFMRQFLRSNPDWLPAQEELGPSTRARLEIFREKYAALIKEV